MAYFYLIFGLGVFAVCCLLDFFISIEMSKYGIKEKNSLFRGKGGTFVWWKGLIFVVGPIALVLIAFFAGEGVEGFDRTYAGLVLVPGALLHLWAYFNNRSEIRKAKEAKKMPGGVV